MYPETNHTHQNMFKYFIVALATAFVCNAIAATDAEVATFLKTLERQLSLTLPSGSPQSMNVSVFAGPGRRITFVSVIDTPANLWTQEMKNHSRQIAVNDYCTNPEMRTFRDHKITAVWQTSDQQGRHVKTNTVASTDCK
jgi:hypothetical protein